MQTVLIVSERPGFHRFDRAWHGATLVEIREFDGSRPAPASGCQYVLSPAEFAFVEQYANTTPLKFRVPGAADTAVAAEESALDRLRAERARIEADIQRLTSERDQMLAAAGEAAEQLEKLSLTVADRETDLERLAQKTGAVTTDRKERRRKRDGAE